MLFQFTKHSFKIVSKIFPTSSSVFGIFQYKRRFICFCVNMENMLKPPDTVKGLTQLDKSLFTKNIEVSYLSLEKTKVSAVLPLIKKYLLKLEKFRPVKNLDNESQIYLNPNFIVQWASFPSEIQEKLSEIEIIETGLKRTTFSLNFDHYSVEDIFKAVLPVDREGMSSYTRIGHIVHVNLREHLLPFKTLIGEVLYDKVSGCKSVVNKTNNIDNTYRNFQMEILKGENDMLTTVKENNCSFKFDFSMVYWNSRLCTEHERIVKKLSKNDVMFDVFSGVGPFSIPLARKGCHVFANDLNPEAYKWLNYNAKANKVDQKNFQAYNKDGRQFINEIIKEQLPLFLERKQNIFITMNLPALATEFLNEFVGLFSENELLHLNEENTPIVIVYCFSKGIDYVNIAKDLVIKGFGFDVSDKIVDIFRVRTVSSLKEMMRITLKLDRDILIRNKRKLEEHSIDNKNKKINNEINNGEKQKEN